MTMPIFTQNQFSAFGQQGAPMSMGQPWTYVIRTQNAEKAPQRQGPNMPQAARGTAPSGMKYILEPMPDYTLPERIYGDTLAKAERIVETYRVRDGVTGALLIGEPGSGKTLMMKVLSATVREKLGIPTVVVNEPYWGDEFNIFLQNLPPCLIIFDEFEKVYRNYAAQESLLTLYDGLFSSKKLMVHTANSRNGINTHFLNRPGRIYYYIEYKGLDRKFVREYCQENLENQQYTSEIVKITALHRAFSFDMLKALVEEMNRYGEEPKVALEMLNITPGSDVVYTVTAKLADGEEISEQYVYPPRIEGNPHLHEELRFNIRNPKNGTQISQVFSPNEETLAVDDTATVYTYVGEDGTVLTFTRSKLGSPGARSLSAMY